METDTRGRSFGRTIATCALVASACAALVIAAPPAGRAAPARRAEGVDPNAMAALARSANYLRGLAAFRLDALVTQDEVVGDDFKLQRGGAVRISVRRPDRMRIELTSDLGDRLFVYDGKRLDLLLKDQNYYGSLAAPSTLRELLAVIEQRGVELPLLDILYVAMGGQLEPNIREAGAVGTSSISGTPCQQLAFRGDRVDWQLWVERSAQALPRKLVITTTDQPTRPQYSALLRWDVNPSIQPTEFTFSRPAGALPLLLGAGPRSNEKRP